MAEELGAQERLDKIVGQIASNMVAEVCSVYVLRADGVLELYATEGLNPAAVHHAGLKVGHGLVGTIAATAAPLNLDDARSHEAFAYLPETGEESFNSFLGVPILRAGRALGVLVVQNEAKRLYREDEVEALETIAMVIAELIAAGELEGLAQRDGELDLRRSTKLSGTALADGLGLGHVVLHEPRVEVENLFNEDAEAEVRRLHASLGSLRASIDNMLDRGDVPQHGETREVLEAYRMFAHDRGWVRRMEEAVLNGLTAEAAVEKVQSDSRARMMRITDPYLRERLHDLDDLAYRLLRELVGKPFGLLDDDTPDAVVVARSMGAAELLDYDRRKLRGLVLEEGGPTSHVVIVARALGIPVVGEIASAVAQAENGDDIILDGQEGEVYIRPTPDIRDAYTDKIAFRAKQQKQFDELRNEPSESPDGVEVELLMNAGLVVDLPQLDQSGAAGIGLFRTELQFMIASKFPRPGEQEALYVQVLDEAGDKPVTFRTLDVGGDKVLPYLRTVPEENPALGWRAVRLALDRPGLLRSQLRALLKAAAGRTLRLMLPMITEAREISRARAILDHEIELLTGFGHEMPSRILLGAMIEVPSILWQLDEFMELIDFASVGSNDLFQFVMASDRGNSQIADRFDAMSRPFMRVLRTIRRKADQHGKPLTLCGELAGRPLEAMGLIGIGFRSISMSPAAIGPVKSMVRSLDVGKLTNALDPLIDEPSGAQTLREFLNDFAAANRIAY